MAFSKNPLLFLYTLLSLETVTTENCALDSDHGFLKYRDACFFAIKNIALKANLKINETHYKFDIAVARRECRELNATLAIFKSKEDQRLLRQHFRSIFNNSKLPVSLIALDILQDMSRGSIEHKWSDGSSITYTGSWLNKDAASLYTVMHLEGSGQWENVQAGFGHKIPVGVVCQKQKQSRSKRSPADNSGTATSVCNQNPQPDDVIQPLVYNDACYFAVNTAAGEANRPIADKFLFNITKARDICRRYNATLPTIQNNDENTWLIEQSDNMLRAGDPVLLVVALGLQQRSDGNSYSYTWDNGQNATFEFTWPTKFSKAAYTVLKIWQYNIRRGRNLYDIWENVPEHSYEWNQTVYIICQQLDAAADSKTTTPKPAPTNISKCDHGSSKAFPRVAVYAGKSCYFAVSGSFEKTYPIGDAFFHIWTAREICNNESASLPVIESEAEYSFILSTFTSADLTGTADSRVRYVALDLQQTTNVDKYQYSDGRPPAYQPDVWKNKTSYAYFISMSFDNVSFINHPGTEPYRYIRVKDNLVGVLCKQPHYSASPSSEAQTQTTASTSLSPSPSPTAAVASSGPTSSIETSSTDKAGTSSVSTPRQPTTPETKMTGIPTGNKCGQEGSQYYKKTAQHGVLCYFVIKDATDDAAVSAGSFNMFNLNNARESCGKHGATLPILYSKSEANFILDHFSASDFPMAHRKAIPAGIALDMDVDKAGHYAWRNGMAVSYKPAKWIEPRNMEDAHTLRVFMHFRTGAGDRFVKWETHDGSELVFLAVLCQQEIEPRVYDPDTNGKRQFPIPAETIIIMLVGGFLI